MTVSSQSLKPTRARARAPGIAPAAPRVGRRPEISRQDVIDAALRLLGPQRSFASLSLREVARAADIAPNSFYRHFDSMDALAIALIEEAGRALREIIGRARERVAEGESVIQSSVEVFLQQLQSDRHYLRLLLREGAVGSRAFKQAVERQLEFFERELQLDLVRLASENGTRMHDPELAARAITRLVFTMAAGAVDLAPEKHAQLTEQISTMVLMVVVGAQTLAAP